MAENLVIGAVIMSLCVSIQCLFAGLLLRLLTALDRRPASHLTLFRAWVALSAVMLIMLAGNLLQIAVWAELFVSLGEFDRYGTALYHSTVNFTTLGYGDVIMSEAHRFLGALEAANGVMMFGLTTSAIFAVVQWLIRRAWEQRQQISDAAH